MDNTLWYIQTMAFYSAVKVNEVLINASMGMNFKNVLLSEKAAHKSSPIVWFHLCEIYKIYKSIYIKQNGAVRV